MLINLSVDRLDFPLDLLHTLGQLLRGKLPGQANTDSTLEDTPSARSARMLEPSMLELRPVDPALLVKLELKPVEDARTGRQACIVGSGGRRSATLLGVRAYLWPRVSAVEHPEHAVERGAVIVPPTAGLGHRHQRLEPQPSLVRAFAASRPRVSNRPGRRPPPAARKAQDLTCAERRSRPRETLPPHQGPGCGERSTARLPSRRPDSPVPPRVCSISTVSITAAPSAAAPAACPPRASGTSTMPPGR